MGENLEDIRPQFGNRFLINEEDVFQHNAWDNVEWDENQELEAKRKVELNGVIKLSKDDIAKHENEADKFWDSFYSVHSNRFFKDRHWLMTEFPELGDTDEGLDKVFFELGCGVGNTVFPILRYSKGKKLLMHCCDFSETAINILKENPEYDPSRCNPFVFDATEEKWEMPFEENSVDVVIMIFVLSAIKPEKFGNIIKEIYRYLKPGGLVLFRDYGRYDLAQLRFKQGRCIGDNFYVRGDGTMVYFFDAGEIKSMFENEGFEEVQNHVDRRLQVNRGKFMKMYRIWIQGKYRKKIN
ncbi:tRNA N(3)-methylcytidine methyltransferase Mettl2 isoform X2 [Onthophagus taurus]|uniref:tRNA N(3)-methylcytidine methyltransferase Mettl2 isoform X2 n=1 Tax=Onthophagus taurus TaxID=166361 RepID=UPI000C20A42A|nr:methyltransferase-like protein 2 isoform X2 [Onthophagus taurus]